jgi:CheY-like chemotaxis protein
MQKFIWYLMRERVPPGRTSLSAKTAIVLWLSAQTTQLGSGRTITFLVNTVTSDPEQRSLILVIEDVEETRHGIERLLTASGYQVNTARDEEEGVLKARLHRPDLILISPGIDIVQVVPVATRIRERTGLGEEVPFVVFCFPGLDEGTEVAAGYNVYMTRPDNFDQLRAFLSRLLRKLPRPC